jgi:hypothetical protein
MNHNYIAVSASAAASSTDEIMLEGTNVYPYEKSVITWTITDIHNSPNGPHQPNNLSIFRYNVTVSSMITVIWNTVNHGEI